MHGIFISYRRQDSQSAAGRLADHLNERLTGVPIFRDVETIEPGVDFVDAITRALQSCGVLLAVVGPRWLTVTDTAGNRRLDNAHDYTRLEVATALKRSDVRVIPVLVEGAQMPAMDDLPDDLKPLSRRNAIELTDKRWDYDVQQLIETLRKSLGLPEGPPAAAAATPVASARKPVMTPRLWVGGAAVVAVLGISTLWVTAPDEVSDPSLVEGPMVTTDPQAVVLAEAGGIDTGAAIQPQPSYAASQGQAPVTDLTGTWVDGDGGQHQVAQTGSRIVIQSQGLGWQLAGAGQMSGLVGWVDYAVEGQSLRAKLEVAADGHRMQLVMTDPITGERDAVTMTRLN